MKLRIIGSMSSGAPIARNNGLIVSMPAAATTPVIRNDRIMLSVARRFALRWSSEPIARATTDEVPAPSPIAILVTIMSIGKPKL